jgi:hypothetical protein
MARMNWNKVRKQHQMRQQGTVRALTEEAERRLKALRERKRRKRQRAAFVGGEPSFHSLSQKNSKAVKPVKVRELRTCTYCGQMTRATRYEAHVANRCPRRPDPLPAAVKRVTSKARS